ncbi:MAG: chemotaxis protein CheW [bacterium]
MSENFNNLRADNEDQLDENFDLKSILWFTLGCEEYAIKVDHVQTVLNEMSLTPVPNTPRFVLGVINLRGVIIPIVDLKEMFQMPRDEANGEMMAVVLEVENMRVGIAVDKVKEVLDIDFSQLQPPPPSLSGLGAEYVKGIHRMGTKILIVIELGKVINIAKEMISKYS